MRENLRTKRVWVNSTAEGTFLSFGKGEGDVGSIKRFPETGEPILTFNKKLSFEHNFRGRRLENVMDFVRTLYRVAAFDLQKAGLIARKVPYGATIVSPQRIYTVGDFGGEWVDAARVAWFAPDADPEKPYTPFIVSSIPVYDEIVLWKVRQVGVDTSGYARQENVATIQWDDTRLLQQYAKRLIEDDIEVFNVSRALSNPAPLKLFKSQTDK